MNSTKVAGFEELPDRFDILCVTPRLIRDKFTLRERCVSDHLIQFGNGTRHRFFTKDMSVGCESQLALICMKRGGGSKHHQIRSRGSQKFRQVGIRRYVPGRRRFRASIEQRVAHADQSEALIASNAWHMKPVSNPAQAYDDCAEWS